MRLGKSNAWKISDSNYRGKNNSAVLAISYENIAPYKHRVTVVITSTSFRVDSLIEKGRVFLCLANKESYRRKYSEFGWEPGNRNERISSVCGGNHDRTFFSSIHTGKFLSPIFHQVVKGKNTYTWDVDFSCVEGDEAGVFRSARMHEFVGENVPASRMYLPMICRLCVNVNTDTDTGLGIKKDIDGNWYVPGVSIGIWSHRRLLWLTEGGSGSPTRESDIINLPII